MASVNMDSIMSKVNKFADSKEGQKRVNDTITSYVKNGVNTTKAGSPIVSVDEMMALGQTLASYIQNAAANANVPASVMNHINDIQVSAPIRQPDGSYIVNLSFGGDLSRASLYPEKYSGGVDNIVALFNNGMSAGNKVYGVWEGHPRTYGRPHHLDTPTGAYISSRQSIEGASFVNTAVATFNNTFGASKNVKASAGGAYT